MTIIQFSEADMSRGKIVEPAWYLMNIINVGEAPSKDGGSTNYPVEGTIIRNADNGDETFKGVTITWNFNSKAIGFAAGLLQALGADVKSNERYKLEMAAGKQVEV